MQSSLVPEILRISFRQKDGGVIRKSPPETAMALAIADATGSAMRRQKHCGSGRVRLISSPNSLATTLQHCLFCVNSYFVSAKSIPDLYDPNHWMGRIPYPSRLPQRFRHYGPHGTLSALDLAPLVAMGKQ